MLLPLIDFSALRLPHAATITPAQTLGRTRSDLPGF